MSTRRVTRDDYYLIKAVVGRTIYLAQKKRKKLWFELLDEETVMEYIYATENAYIVDGAYLVVYEIGTPWYSKESVLNELLVLRLVPGGSFENVALFLKRSAMEAGARLVVAGTALAKADAALVSMYNQQGFQQEAVSLTWAP